MTEIKKFKQFESKGKPKKKLRFRRESVTTGLASVGADNTWRGWEILVGNERIGSIYCPSKGSFAHYTPEEEDKWKVRLHASGYNKHNIMFSKINDTPPEAMKFAISRIESYLKEPQEGESPNAIENRQRFLNENSFLKEIDIRYPSDEELEKYKV